jgi:DNA (cytosine-5)-methyltransferase 1
MRLRDGRRRLVDLCCSAGGATRGYQRAGFYVAGVDEFYQADALEFPLEGFDAIHASPPCQAYTNAQRIQGRKHPELLEPIRRRLRATGQPYVIENVPGAPLVDPELLCGAMFDLGVYRHRLFETSFALPFMLHAHGKRQTKMGRRPKDGDVIQVVGHFSDVTAGRRAMGIDWMTRDELKEAIPPAYTEWIGRHLMAAIEQAAA